jgi:hypothetical protein
MHLLNSLQIPSRLALVSLACFATNLARSSSITALAGHPLTISVSAVGTTPFVYQWYKNGAKIAAATAPTFSIASVSITDAGNYDAVVSNPAGFATSDIAAVTVAASAVAPTIVTQPASQTVLAGASVTFTTAVSATPAPTYQWRLNGTAIDGATSASYAIAHAAEGNAGTYTVVATNSAGSATSNAAVLTVDSQRSLVSADFVGNGFSDLLWEDLATGQIQIWIMSGTQKTATASFSATAGSDWVLAATGDFNGDGETDLLWQNTVTGAREIELLKGTTLVGWVSLPTVSTSWSIVGTGNFSGSGKTDILWQNSVTGEISVWRMNGTKYSSAVSLGVVPLAWRIAGTGDFNGDGKVDILWQNRATGEASIWLMNGTALSSVVSLGFEPLEWQIAGTGIFAAEGGPAIVWQNLVTGQRVVWLMNGTVFARDAVLGSATLQWLIVGGT